MGKNEAAEEMPNILLITIDSLRSDHVGCYGYFKSTTPNIDELASKGTLFLQAVANGGSTPDAFPSLLASALPPLTSNEYRTIIRHHTPIAEVLRQAGYHTAAFHSNPYLTRIDGYDKGIDSFNDHLARGSGDLARTWVLKAVISRLPFQWIRQYLARIDTSILSMSLLAGHKPFVPAPQINKQAISWLKSHKDRFFLWLHYMDTHHPYLPARKYLHQLGNPPISRWQMIRLYYKLLREPDKISPDDAESLPDLYDACIRYLDENIGALLSQMEDQLKNAIVILTADHGDQFGEHGNFGHQLSLYEGTVRVPLIIAGPGISAGNMVAGPVSHLDIAPTLIDLLGMNKIVSFYGESILPLLMKRGSKKNKAAISTLTVPGAAGTLSTFGLQRRLIAYRTPVWKYIRTEGYSNGSSEVLLSEEIYNLKDDPGETTNLNGLQTDEVRRFRRGAIKSVSQFKKDKLVQATNVERQRIKQKAKELSKL